MVAANPPKTSGADQVPARPAVHERLIMPETRYEVIDGEVIYVSPADPPHASRHSKLAALLEAYTADGFDAAVDMLTRTSEKGDMAPDGSIYPEDPDPETGGRQLEHLAFEVLSSQTLAEAGRKAARLRERGVRRVFGIDVERARLCEWSTSTDSWQILRNDDAIEDLVLVAPLPIAALVGAAKTDDAVAKALLVKGNPVIGAALENASQEGEARGRAEGEVRGRAEGEARGRAEGARGVVLAIIRARFGAPDETVIDRVAKVPESELASLAERLVAAPSLESALGDR